MCMINDFIAIDFEFMPKQRYIFQIGYVVVKNRQIVRRVEQLIKPPCTRNEYNSCYILKELTGITYDMLESAPTLEEVWPEIYQQITDRIVVAHNACSAELSVLTKELDRIGISRDNSNWPAFQCYCTLEYARFIGHSRCGLDVLCSTYNLDLTKHHNAMADAEATALLFLAMVNDTHTWSPIQYDYNYYSANNNSSNNTQQCADSVLTQLVSLNNEVQARKYINLEDIQEQLEEDITNLNCFRGDVIVLTGLTIDDKEYLTNLLISIGATVKRNVTKNTTCIIAGEFAGWAKLEKAVEMNIPVINRDCIKV